MTYKKRSLKFEFKLKEGKFDDKGNDTLTLSDIKAEVEIGAYGGVSGSTLEGRIFGLSIDLMAKLSYKGIQLNGAKQNLLKVWADDKIVFFGTITNCFADFNQMPDAPLIISGNATGYEQSIPAPPFSSNGSVDVADIITSIAKSVGFTVVNNGVSYKLSNPYFDGNPIEQMRKAAKAAGINFDPRLGVVFIWPQTGSVDDVKPFISPDNGLLGYPVFSNYGVSFQCTYTDLLILGRRFELETSLPNASGTYTLVAATHHLSSWMEGGPWTTIGRGALAQLTEIRQ